MLVDDRTHFCIVIIFLLKKIVFKPNELKRNSLGNPRPQSPHLAEPLWTDPVLKSGISVRDLISTLKKQTKQKNEKRRRGNGLSNILPKS